RGVDLNREFWRGSLEPEVAIMERELLQHKFHGIISLHSDDTSDGVYGFVRGATLTQHLLKPALAAAEAALPGTSPSPFEIILETPHHAPMDLQRRAFVLALAEILRHYRRLISYAAD